MPTTLNKYYIEMTGSPRDFGFKTKEKFLDTVKDFGVVHVTIANCNYLITDDLTSKSIKMRKAKSHRAKIVTYGDFVNMFRVEMRAKKISELKKKMSERQLETA